MHLDRELTRRVSRISMMLVMCFVLTACNRTMRVNRYIRLHGQPDYMLEISGDQGRTFLPGEVDEYWPQLTVLTYIDVRRRVVFDDGDFHVETMTLEQQRQAWKNLKRYQALRLQ